MSKIIEPLIKGQQPQVTVIRGATPQRVTIIHEGVQPQGGVQPQHTETGHAGSVKPPASK
jgi:hypothetical protein